MTKNDKAAPEKSPEDKNTLKGPGVDAKSSLNQSAIKTKPSEEKQKASWSTKILLVLVIFISGSAVGIYLMPTLKERFPTLANWVGDDSTAKFAVIDQQFSAQQAEITTLRQKSLEFENRLNQPSQDISADIPENLELRISALEESLSIASELPSTGTQNIPDNSQSARIDALLSRMSQLEASFVPLSRNMIDAGRANEERQALITESATLSSKITQLESRLISVEQVAAKDNSAILLNLKISELKRKLLAGASYGEELLAVNELVENGPLVDNSRFSAALNVLAENSTAGVMTVTQISNDFNALIPALMNAEGIDENAPWWQNTLSSIKNMVTVRKTDGSSLNDNGLDSLIAEIEARLQSGNINSALEIVDTMPDTLKTSLGSWTSNAQSWLQSEAAITALESIAAENYLTPAAISAQGASL